MAIGQGQNIGSAGDPAPAVKEQTIEEFMIERNSGGRKAAQPAATAQPAETEETAPRPPVTAPEAPEKAPEKEPPKAGPEKPASELDKRLERLERLERLVLINGGVKGGAAPQAAAEPKEADKPLVAPRLEDFESNEAFEQARTEYLAEIHRREARQATRATQVEQFTAELDRKFETRLAEAVKTDATLMDAVNDPTLSISPVMTFIIKDSDVGPAIVRYLADHREEAQKIAYMHPAQAAREMGRIEARLLAALPAAEPQAGEAPAGKPAAAPAAEKPAPKVVSKAPEPVKPVGGQTGTLEMDDEKVPIEEFVRRRNEKQYGKRR
jgi:hypothetical protein